MGNKNSNNSNNRTVEVDKNLKKKFDQTDVIFTDIRGVLIKNTPELSKCFVGDTIYGGTTTTTTINSIKETKFDINGDTRPYEILNSPNEADFHAIQNTGTEQSKLLRLFLISLVCNHGDCIL